MSPETGELLVKEVAPRIQSLAHSLTPIGCEDRAEQAADAVAFAAALLVSAKRRSKAVTPGNVSHYAIALVRQGRRSTGKGKTDAMHPGTQIVGRSSLVSLDAPLTSEADGEEITCLHETLASGTEDPAVAATRRLDWRLLVELLDHKAREVLGCLVVGEDLTCLKSKLQRSRSAIQNDRRDWPG